VGDIFVASAGLYDSSNGHIGVVIRAWNGSSFGTMEQNGGARYVARYDRSMANMDGFLRPINQGAIAASVTPVSSQGDHIAAEGNDWTYWVPSTQDQATVQAGLALAGVYSGAIDGNLVKEESIRAIQLVTGKFGFFDLNYHDGQMNKNLCHGILLMAQAHGGYTGRMDWQIDGHVWAAFDTAIRATAPAPVVVVPVVEPEEVVVEEVPVEDTETTQPVTEPVEEVPAVIPTATGTPLPREKYIMSAEETAKQNEQIAALPAADLGAIIPSAKGRIIAYGIFATVALVVTNTAVYFTAIGTPFPELLLGAMAIVGNLAVPFAALAVANARTANKTA
jgi:hypothetical protein